MVGPRVHVLQEVEWHCNEANGRVQSEQEPAAERQQRRHVDDERNVVLEDRVSRLASRVYATCIALVKRVVDCITQFPPCAAS